jgi:hypothetical protein
VFLIIKKIEDIKKRKINAIKEIINQKKYLVAVLRCKKIKKKNASVKNLENEIAKIINKKQRHINNLLILKSAFSVIDDMFVREIKNAEKRKTLLHKLSHFFFCFFDKEKHTLIEPTKLNTFIEEVMDPYGRQDKLIKELREKEINKRKTGELKNVLKEVKNTKKLLKGNIFLTEQIYDRMERGASSDNREKSCDNDISSKLWGFFTKKQSQNREPAVIPVAADLTMDSIYNRPIYRIDCNSELDVRSKGSVSGSNSSNSLMDFDVVGAAGNQ